MIACILQIGNHIFSSFVSLNQTMKLSIGYKLVLICSLGLLFTLHSFHRSNFLFYGNM